MTQIPAGWFPDPERPDGVRYWDGGNWTEHRASAEQSGVMQQPQHQHQQQQQYQQYQQSPNQFGQPVASKPRGLFWKIPLGVLGAFLALVFIVALVNPSDSNKTSATSDETSEPAAPKSTKASGTSKSAEPSASAPKSKSPTKSKATKPKKVGTKSNPAPVGKAVGNKSAKYKILSVKVTDSLGAYADKPAGRYVVVELEVTNVKKETIQVSASDFTLRVDGTEIETDDNTYMLDDGFGYDDISPGLAKRGRVAFDVIPKNAGKGVVKAVALFSFDDPIYLSLK